MTRIVNNKNRTKRGKRSSVLQIRPCPHFWAALVFNLILFRDVLCHAVPRSGGSVPCQISKTPAARQRRLPCVPLFCSWKLRMCNSTWTFCLFFYWQHPALSRACCLPQVGLQYRQVLGLSISSSYSVLLALSCSWSHVSI